MRARRYGLVALMTWMVCPAQATADCSNTQLARVAYERGERAMLRHDIEAAVQSFSEANKQCPNPKTQLAIAGAYLLAGQAKQAAEALDRYVASAATAADWCSVLDVRHQIAALSGTAEHDLTVRLQPKTARPYIRESAGPSPDPAAPGCPIQAVGERFGAQLPPGNYTVTGLLAEREPVVAAFEFSKPTTIDVVFPYQEKANIAAATPNSALVTGPIVPASSPFSVVPPESPRWYARTETWVWVGSGVVAVASAAAGLWALSLQSELNRDCPQRRCPEGPSWTTLDRRDRLATISTVGFVLAGAGAATGAGVYFALGRSTEHEPNHRPRASVGPGQLTLSGRF